jgi:DtxR family Mn-dependent transcriptional regulator
MDEFELSEAAEEILAGLWTAREERGQPSLAASELATDGREEAVRELLEAGLAEQHAGTLSVTESGAEEAESIVRRERLAERLLVDVLDLGEPVAREAACKFEHLLRRGIDDEICTLLGHPQACPHGSPIPRGECCREGARAAGKVVSTLADLAPGQRGVIAYIHGTRREMMQRLLSMGAVPGAPIALLQRAPSFVFQLGHTQVAVDRETARDIYVRLTATAPVPVPPPRWFSHPFRGLRFRRGRRRR